MTRYAKLTCGLVVLLLCPNVQAQVWNKKDWRQWSAKDCDKVLTDSPWAQTWISSATQMLHGSQQSQIPGSRGPELYVRYHAAFFSALPVREAEVRLGQIQAHYDQMSAAQKAAFDQSAQRFLAVPFPNDMIIRVTYKTNVQYIVHSLIDFWQRQNTESMRLLASLYYEKQTIQASRYVCAPGVEPMFYLYFPRQVNGNVWLESVAKTVALQIRTTGLQFSNAMGPPGGVTAMFANGMNFDFKPKKMLMQGKLYY